MPALTDDRRFFGLDLSSLGRDLGAAWQSLHCSPPFSWLTPEAPVRLLRADGGNSPWFGAEKVRTAASGDDRQTDFLAVELPEELVLRRRLVVPAMSDGEIADAVALEVATASPFPPDDTVWGHDVQPMPSGQRRVDAALASRKQVERHLKAMASRLAEAAPSGRTDAVEVWALGGEPMPIVLSGFGEKHRIAKAAAGRKKAIWLLALAVLLGVAIACTPTAQLRLRAFAAVERLDALSKRVAPQAAKREVLVNASDRLTVLRDLLADRVEPLRVIDTVTRVLPDDTWLQSLRIDGNKVGISGLTLNSAALMQTLGAQPGLHDVKAPTPATRHPGTPKENFNIEFMVDPKLFQSPEPGANAAASVATDTPAPAIAEYSRDARTASPPKP
ncbi:MAG: PilN domain-containing protein [Burkholderiales bacterium]